MDNRAVLCYDFGSKRRCPAPLKAATAKQEKERLTMKKLFAFVLALALVCLGSAALAVNEDVEGTVGIYSSMYPFVIDMMDEAIKEEFPNLTPAFDSQEDVLNQMVADLDAAAAILTTASAPAGAALDPMYGGSPAKWRKYANSLRMRILCLETGIDEAYWADIQAMIDNPSDYPVFTSNADNAKVTFQDLDPYRSSMGPTAVASFFNAYNMTEQIIGMMNVKNDEGNDVYQDPRLPIFAAQKGGKWTGAVAGCAKSEMSAEQAKKPAEMNDKVLWRDAMDAFIMEKPLFRQ